jgi:hypothetical protein
MKVIHKHAGFGIDAFGRQFELSPDLTRKIAQEIDGQINEIIAEMFSDEATHFHLPFIWEDSDGSGGPPVSDPLTIYLTIDGDCQNGIVIDLNFRETMIEQYSSGGIHDDKVLELSKALRELADMLEATTKEK